MKFLLSLSVSLLFVFPLAGQKKVLIEKFTNKHCGVCPDGTVEIEELQEKYPDLIWVTHHKPISWEENELNNLQSTALYNDLGSPGNPTAMVDRTAGGSNLISSISSWENRVITQLDEAITANIDIDEVSFEKETRTFSFKVNTTFVNSASANEYRVSVMIIQDYWDSSGGQSSYFNDSSGHPLEGLGSTIWDYEHRNVVRAILDNHWGTENVIPSNPLVGETYSKDYSYTAPDNFRLDRMKVVAFVSKHDANSLNARPVLNVVEIAMNDYGFQLSSLGTIEPDDKLSVSVSPNPVSITAHITYTEIPSLVQLISMTGQVIYEVIPEAAALSLDVSSYDNGTYILLAQTGETRLAKPLIINNRI